MLVVKYWNTFFVILWFHYYQCFAFPDLIRLGALMDTEDEEQQMAFEAAIEQINADSSMLPQSRLAAKIERLDHEAPFVANRKVCDILQTGVAAVFGPQSSSSSSHVQSICDDLEVLHIFTRWQSENRRDTLSINLHPDTEALNLAFIRLLKAWAWKDFYVVYEEDEGIIRMQDFLKESEQNDWKIKIYQFPNSSSYRDTFWDIKNSLDRRKKLDSEIYYNIILDVPRENLYEVLKSAQQVGMMTEKQRYIITSLDLHSIDLEDFQYSKTNMTGLRLIQEENPEFKTLLDRINKRITRRRNQPLLKTLRTESVLMYEAVKMFARVLEEMSIGKNISAFQPISCNLMSKGTDGTTLLNYMKHTVSKGMTGEIALDSQGFRSVFSMDIMYLTNEGLVKVGTVKPSEMINITKKLSVETEYSELENKCYIVTVAKGDPYVMLKDSTDGLSGNARYEGFMIDMLSELAQYLHFTFKIKEVKDGKHGEKLDDGTWNGMIGEILNGEADMAAGDVTITLDRESVVDFTTPFINTGISIAYKRPTTKVTSLFSFLSPFSGGVWLCVMVAYTAFTLILFVVGRLSPYEWGDPHPCRKAEDKVEENSYSLLNSMWFTIGSLMQQGSDVSPEASSTRTIAAIWYFFNLIMISSYTANLAAFLTIERIVYPFNNVEELAKQTKIKYGCKSSGSTKTFFKNSSVEIYQKMWKFMEKHQDEVLLGPKVSYVEKILKNDYAYFTEAVSIEYKTERVCELTMIGGMLDSKGYGIAVRKGQHKMISWLSVGILHLQELGVLHNLKERWWKQKKGGGKCAEDAKKSTVNELGLGNVGGVFVVMLLGLALSAFVAVLEFMWFSRKLHKEKDESIFKTLLKELKFAASCGSSVKPAPNTKARQKKKSKSPVATPYNTVY